MKQTMLALTTLAVLSTGLTTTAVQANDSGAAAAGFLGGLFTGLVLGGPPPRHAPPRPLVIERHYGPRYDRHYRPRYKNRGYRDWHDDRRPPRHWRD